MNGNGEVAGADHIVVIGLAATSIDEVVAVARGARVEVAQDALHNVLVTHEQVQRMCADGRPVYGLTTGVGDLVTVPVAPEAVAVSQLNILKSHASGVGAPLDEVSVRAIMVTMVKALAQGSSGVSPRLVLGLAEMLNRRVTPWAPSQGSVGYLIATAHIGLSLFGLGRSYFDGELLDGSEALRRAGIDTFEPDVREGHALVSGTYEVTGIGALAVHKTRELVLIADAAGGLSVEALRGNIRGYDERLQRLRPHPGQIETASRLRALLADSEILEANRGYRIQDALSLRCIPQVHGSVRDVIDFAETVVTTEINSVTDNPVFVVEDGELIALAGGNGHGAPIAVALDMLAIAVAELSTMSQARSDRLTHRHLSELPAFLVTDGGTNSGYMIPPYVAAALASENRGLAAPATVHTVTTSGGQEDHVSMGVTAAIQARTAANNAASIVAIELLCGAQAIEFHQPLRPGIGTAAVYEAIRRVVPRLTADREMWRDISLVTALIDDGTLSKVIKAVLIEPVQNAKVKGRT
jgi:histidine ammonia-lyase